MTRAVPFDAWIEQEVACLAVYVQMAGHNVEIIGRAPVRDVLGEPKSAAQVRAELLADVRAQWRAQPTVPVPLPLPAPFDLDSP